ncbi:MAG: M1 family metallopeptidase [Bacteroidetes bacterium]|nr:M1 family metallopeptidase [Bacteroidota bacterium]
MNYCKRIVVLIFLFLSEKNLSQIQLPVSSNIQSSYAKGTRSPDGKPGKNYWQNKAYYNIAVNFNPDNRKLSGTVEIQYFNNSPDTLKEIWFKLYPNLYKKGSIQLQKIDSSDLTDGVRIENIKINGQDSNVNKPVIDGTNMALPVDPILPKQITFFTITYSYTLNKTSHIRTGEIEPGADFVAYFFPRVAVYDDVDGWNKFPYNGTQEFYNDFCHFFVSVTVPVNYIVWATGNHTNRREVFNEKYVDRIDLAEKSDSVVKIIDAEDLQNGNITNPQNTTWKFEADNVTDFAFATSDHYLWQSTSLIVDPAFKRRVRVDAAFNPKHKSFFNVIGYARKTVEKMSYVFPKYPFPYPHESVFDGLDQMEYPMMVNDNPLENKAEDVELTDHEIFHTMFPFYMGINETKYGWMDEGWATIGEWLLSPMIDTSIEDGYGMMAYERAANTEADPPVITPTTELTGIAMFNNSYPKPALGYLFVKDLLGDELFTKALHYYINEWNGKHPMPYDFFNCMNEGSGINLNWFWKRWFFDNGAPNLAITDVHKKGKEYAAVIEMKGTKPVPVDLTVFFDDSTHIFLHRNISAWEYGNKAISIPFTSAKIVKKLVLGSLHIPDSDKSDNVYNMK